MDTTAQKADDATTVRDAPAAAPRVVDRPSTDPKERERIEIIAHLGEPCDRKTYQRRLHDAAEGLGVSVRQVERLLKRWAAFGSAGLMREWRADKGTHRIPARWRTFILDAYKPNAKPNAKRGQKTFAQVEECVRNEPGHPEWGHKPSDTTVRRFLTDRYGSPRSPEKRKPAPRIGWRGDRLAIRTRDGRVIEITYSNQCWQLDHTQADILLVDEQGEIVGRPYLSIVIDTYSRCIVGFELSLDPRSSVVVALAIRHAALPKSYGPEYGLHCLWTCYGLAPYLFTDSGPDLIAAHISEHVARELNFTSVQRERPSEGGIVERPFGTFNTKFFSTLPGYTGSSVAERPPDAEKSARLTLDDLEKRFVRYIVDNYNQQLDARMGNQARMDRWEAGLLAPPPLIPERKLDICLLVVAHRVIYEGGHLRFANLVYQEDLLKGYAGEHVILRYDPRDVTTVLVYKLEPPRPGGGECAIFLATAHAEDIETERISFAQAKAAAKRLRKKGKAINNEAIAAEVRDRDAFVAELEGGSKQGRKQRRRDAQERFDQRHGRARNPALDAPAPPHADTRDVDEDDTRDGVDDHATTALTDARVWDYDEVAATFRREW